MSCNLRPRKFDSVLASTSCYHLSHTIQQYLARLLCDKSQWLQIWECSRPLPTRTLASGTARTTPLLIMVSISIPLVENLPMLLHLFAISAYRHHQPRPACLKSHGQGDSPESLQVSTSHPYRPCIGCSPCLITVTQGIRHHARRQIEHHNIICYHRN
jgi:hypothetical protein